MPINSSFLKHAITRCQSVYEHVINMLSTQKLIIHDQHVLHKCFQYKTFL